MIHTHASDRGRPDEGDAAQQKLNQPWKEILERDNKSHTGPDMGKMACSGGSTSTPTIAA